MTLKEAFRVSCVPCYVNFAKQIGDEKYKKYLNKFDYGNKSINVENEDADAKLAFWISGDLKISQEEQVAFLRRLYDYKLPVKKETIDIVKEILVDETGNGFVLSGKPGRGISKDGKEIGWYVGYAESKGNVYFFATNFESSEPQDNFNPARKEITIKILKQLEIIE